MHISLKFVFFKFHSFLLKTIPSLFFFLQRNIGVHINKIFFNQILNLAVFWFRPHFIIFYNIHTEFKSSFFQSLNIIDLKIKLYKFNLIYHSYIRVTNYNISLFFQIRSLFNLVFAWIFCYPRKILFIFLLFFFIFWIR